MSDVVEKSTVEAAPVQPPSAPVVAPAAHPAGPSNGLAIASMILGILAILSGWFFMGLIFGIVAIVLGIIALKKPGGKGMSITGLITGGIGALSSLIFVAIFFIALAVGGAAASEGGVIKEALDQVNADQQAQIDAKKDFNKGETATFGEFAVTVNSTKRNYVPEESYYAPDVDEEYVLVNLSAKNTSNESQSLSGYELSLNADGISDTSYYINVSPEFEGGTLSPDATATGNLVFKIAKGAKTLKLQYEKTVYDTTDYSAKKLTYTLGL
jgi:hypothetical protein